jgi:hypothetical protein
MIPMGSSVIPVEWVEPVLGVGVARAQVGHHVTGVQRGLNRRTRGRPEQADVPGRQPRDNDGDRPASQAAVRAPVMSAFR